MISLFNKSEVINNIKKLSFRAKKTFGQNFLVDYNIVSEKFNDTVIEIGPGFGILTSMLAKNFRQVLSIEIDKKLFDFVSEKFSNYKNIKFINQDALKINIEDLVFNYLDNSKNIVLCANLPYSITTPILTKVLKSDLINYITVMVQKEAAERITASLGSRGCGAISYFVRYYSNPKINFLVSKNCFFPVPKVDSAVISFDKIKRQNLTDETVLLKVIKSAFEKRRKNILNSLSSGLGLEKNFILEILKKCNLDKNLRAENLTLENFVSVSEYLK